MTSAAKPDIALAERLFDELRCKTSATCGVSRVSYGQGEQIAHDMIRREADRLGLMVRTDAGCNLYVTLPGAARAPCVMIGSHLDSVPMGGNFDGAAGVLLGLSVIAGLKAAAVIPPQSVTVMAIRAEESAWFGASYIGSRAAFGLLEQAELDGIRRAGDDMPLGTAIQAAGGDPAVIVSGPPALRPGDVGVFIEPHIEQGPVLLATGLPIGIVTDVRGSFRHREARCLGAYTHSGASQREGRQDAVRAVSELVVTLDAAWESLAGQGHDLTVTVGQFWTDPVEASFSKVAGDVRFSLDVRSASESTLAMMRDELASIVRKIEGRTGVRFELGPLTASDAAQMSPAVVVGLTTAAREIGIAYNQMPCGAGHDAAVFARNGVPTGMVFIRNSNGSHNPDEHMEIEDFAKAAEVVLHFIQVFRPPGQWPTLS